MALPVYRAMAYGPSQGEYTHSTNYGNFGQLQQGDIAISPNLLSQYPMGTLLDVVNPSTGQVLRSGVRVADTSWITSGEPTTNSFELWNDQDLGHASLVPHSGDSSSASTDGSTAPSYFGADTAGSAAPAVSTSQWGSPLLNQIAQLQAVNALSQSGGAARPQGNQVVSALNNAIRMAQIMQKLRGGVGGASSLTGNLGDFLGSGDYRAGLGQADPFAAGGSFDVAA